MKSLILPLVDWSNGIVMIGVFAAVCIILVLSFGFHFWAKEIKMQVI